MSRAMCSHCRERPVNRPRGLCWKCYYTPGLKENYGSQVSKGDSMTEADVEAMIAERMKNLPAWWHTERGD